MLSSILVLACFTLLIAGPDSAIAQYVDSPDWVSGPTGDTYGTALGDVDLDGDLDLVCAQADVGLLIYTYGEDGFSILPTWTGGTAALYTWIVLGDVDLDGDLDLACTSYGDRNSVYRNDGGVFTAEPIWIAEVVNYTLSGIALGDVDNDGDLDLVYGHVDACNTLYRNDGGDSVFTSSPIWQSALAYDTSIAALGDLDADGDLDLVCSNFNNAGADSNSNTVYRNDGGESVFTSTPVWMGPDTECTFSMELGDIDGDGDLDLVCGNETQDTMYRNTGGIFESTPAWVSTSPVSTNEIALGDVDKDGDLDLVCNQVSPEHTVLYLNEAGTFSTEPACTVNALGVSSAADIVLGDVDSDGDLDLICGNRNASSKLYLARTEPIETGPCWTSASTNSTVSVVLSDVDLDGDLDLVCGNSSMQGATLYRDDGDYCTSEPTWTGAATDWTECIAVGDVNGDGLPDLVCGNALEQKNSLYLGDGEAFSFSPAWLSGLENETTGVVLGDVDRDGDLDLVCGNLGAEDTLYRNDGGTFTLDPVWQSGPVMQTACVALGDFDGDDDLDLVCGTVRGGAGAYEPCVLYRNDGGDGVFTQEPVWSSVRESDTVALAIGDFDMDGDPDLACGNRGTRNTIYRNDAGVLNLDPVWTSGLENDTYGVAFADMDGDADLDLVCANFNQRNTVYLNDGGEFGTVPVWESAAAVRSTCVSIGDMNGDGDVDVVFGNSGQANSIYASLWNPVYKGDPANPTNQLANTGAHLRSMKARFPAANSVEVDCQVVDVESDPVWVIPEYSFEGSGIWTPLDLTRGRGRLGPLASSPAGEAHRLRWEISTIPSDDRKVVLRLRAISNQSRTGFIHHVASHMLDLGRLTPRRSEIQVSVGGLAFPTVSLGDTVSVAVEITNGGNENLLISGVTFPGSEFLLADAFPLGIEPNASRELTIALAPRVELAVSGEVQIHSNDPLQAVLALPVQTDIRDLVVETTALAPGPEMPLGQALTVQVIPAPEVVVERGTLYYRQALAGGGFDSVELVPSGSSFIGVIPGAAVTEADLEFYVRVENSGIFRTDPAGAPDTLFFQDVASPTGIVTAPQGGAGGRFVANRSINVLVSLEEGVVFTGGALHYRRGGETAYQTSALAQGELGPQGTIPETFVGERGVEYWVEVSTQTNPRITDPPTEPEQAPRALRTSVIGLEESVSSPGGRYRMVSIPLEFGSDFQGNLGALLSDEQEFGLYDPSVWRCFRYLPADERNVEMSEAEASVFRPQPGRGFWLISRSEHRVDSAPIEGLSTVVDSTFAVTLEPGWNQIGTPFAFPVAWSSVTRSSAVEDPVVFDSGVDDYVEDPATVLEPFQAYFVRNLAAAPEVIRVPPAEWVESPAAASSGATQGEPDWRFTMQAFTSGLRPASISIGAHPAAADEYDELDRSSPPCPPGQWIRLDVSNRDWDWGEGLYRCDYRPVGREGYRWDLELRSHEAGTEVEIRGGSVAETPAAWALRLIDTTQSVVTDLRAYDTYRLIALGPDKAYALVLLIGTEEYVAQESALLVEIPNALVLDRNVPNPFRGMTRIRFGLPDAAEIDFSVYDLAGRRVICLERGRFPAGYRTVLWDGREGGGRPVAAGVYFYRLVANGSVRGGKMVRIR